jgi:FkbM family methyltransferase
MNEKSNTPEFIESPHGVKVPLSSQLRPSHQARIKQGGYEGTEVDGVKAIVSKGDRVLECGAGVGVVSAIAAVNGKPEAVLSYEANPNLIEPIRALHKLNKLQKQMEVRNEILLAGPDQPKSVSFSVRGNFLGSRIAAESRRGSTVEVKTADYAVVKEEFKPNVIIMDIEGGESDFLHHADLSGIRAIIVEFHPAYYGIEGMRALKKILMDQGFNRLDCSSRTVWAAVRELA